MQVLPLCHLVWVQEGPHTCMCSDIFAPYRISDGQWQLCLSMKIHYVSPLGFEASICICICGINDVELPNSSPAEPAARKKFTFEQSSHLSCASLFTLGPALCAEPEFKVYLTENSKLKLRSM